MDDARSKHHARSGVAGSRVLIDRFQAALASVDELDSKELHDAAHELVATLLAMYGEGLRRILAALERAGPAGVDLRQELVADDVVASLLLIHDLYPVDLATRVERGLARARNHLGPHGSSIELVALEDGVAHVRLSGTCNGRPSPGSPSQGSPVETLLRQAVEAEAPDLIDLVVETAPSGRERGREPAAAAQRAPQRAEPPFAASGQPDLTGTDAPRDPSILAGALDAAIFGAEPSANGNGHAAARLEAAAGAHAPARSTRLPATWAALELDRRPAQGTFTRVRAGLADLLLFDVERRYLAFQNRCAACRVRIDTGRLVGRIFHCEGCGAAYDVTRAGRAMRDGAPGLEPVPLLRGEDGELRAGLPA